MAFVLTTDVLLGYRECNAKLAHDLSVSISEINLGQRRVHVFNDRRNLEGKTVWSAQLQIDWFNHRLDLTYHRTRSIFTRWNRVAHVNHRVDWLRNKMSIFTIVYLAIASLIMCPTSLVVCLFKGLTAIDLKDLLLNCCSLSCQKSWTNNLYNGNTSFYSYSYKNCEA